MYALYVIPGSHACRSAMLMLEHKRVPYRRVNIIPGLHPIVGRMRGFDAGGQLRHAGGRRTLAMRLGDNLATVPGLACDGERISTNHDIARFLDARHPQPPLFPADAQARAAVEEAERWANSTLQMAARRIPGAALLRDPDLALQAGDGRLGYLLFRHARVRRAVMPRLLKTGFAVSARRERDPMRELPEMLDRIDAWINDGVLGGVELNAADYMVAPSLALILYRPDVRAVFEGRPALELVDRVLPEPALASQAAVAEPA
jgi:glutathione S-transferase